MGPLVPETLGPAVLMLKQWDLTLLSLQCKEKATSGKSDWVEQSNTASRSQFDDVRDSFPSYASSSEEGEPSPAP